MRDVVAGKIRKPRTHRPEKALALHVDAAGEEHRPRRHNTCGNRPILKIQLALFGHEIPLPLFLDPPLAWLETLLISSEKHSLAPSFRRKPLSRRECRHPAQKSPKSGGKGPRQAFKAFFSLFIEPNFGASERRAWVPPSGRTRAPAGVVLSPRTEAGRARKCHLRAALRSVSSRAGCSWSLFESSHPLESGQKKRGAPLREHLCIIIVDQEWLCFQEDKCGQTRPNADKYDQLLRINRSAASLSGLPEEAGKS